MRAVPEGADPLRMAMLSINPPTAELLLRELVKLKPGDSVLRNAANSAVGHYLIMLARCEGYRTVNLEGGRQGKVLLTPAGPVGGGK